MAETEIQTVEKQRQSRMDPDFQYHIDGYLKSNLDLIVKRTHNMWDNLIIVDGLERAGKTTLTITCCAYLGVKLKREFSAKNIFFNIDELTEFAQSTREQIILWDEAVLGGMGQQWASSEQMKLKQLLVTCGKYKHIIFFIIPDFTILAKYFAVHRSVALIRIYSPDNISRGYFKFYNMDQKKILYDMEKKGVYFNNGVTPSFFGRFSNHRDFIDHVEYEKKKDKAISQIGQENSTSHLHNVIEACHIAFKVPYVFAAKVMKCHTTQLSNKLKLLQERNALIKSSEVLEIYEKLAPKTKKKASFVMPTDTEEMVEQK